MKTPEQKLDELKKDLIEGERHFKDPAVAYGWLRRSVLIALGMDDVVEANCKLPKEIQ